MAELVLPFGLALMVALAATAAHRPIRPIIAARILAGTLAALTLAALPLLVVVAATFVAHRPPLLGLLEWCRHLLGSHDSIPAWAGMGSVLVLGIGAVRSIRVLRTWWEFRRSDGRPIEVVATDALFACTLPGSGGRILVSRGLMATLEPDEVAVVLAHERAHARCRHDRYLLLGDLAVAVLPPLRPLRRRLVYVLERWADEASVDHVDGNRGLVARTLAIVATSHASVPAGAHGFARLGVADRVSALLDPSPASRGVLGVTMMVGGAAIVAAGAALQLHHVAPLIVSLCWP